MKNILNDFEVELNSLELKFRKLFTKNILKELKKLEYGEIVPMSDPDCEFSSIPTGYHSDAFRNIDSKGMAAVYNNLSCDIDTYAYDDLVSVLGFSSEVLKKVYICLLDYNAKKELELQSTINSDDLINLGTILVYLDVDSKLASSLRKAIEVLKKNS